MSVIGWLVLVGGVVWVAVLIESRRMDQRARAARGSANTSAKDSAKVVTAASVTQLDKPWNLPSHGHFDGTEWDSGSERGDSFGGSDGGGSDGGGSDGGGGC